MLSSFRCSLSTGLAAVLILGAGCIFSPDKSPDPGPEPDPEIVPNDQPDNLIKNLETIYQSKTRGASERYEAYADLFPPTDGSSELQFIFKFQQRDIEAGLPPSWGISDELGVHRNMFDAQEAGNIYSLSLVIQRTPPRALDFPEPYQAEWRQIDATNVNLRLMENPSDGYLVDGGQAKFWLAPENDRWYIVEWEDMPRP